MLWTLEIKRLIADIDYAANQVGDLVKVLHALQTNCAQTSNKLANVLERIKANISKKMGDARKEMDKIEAELKAVRCEWKGWWFWRRLDCNVANATRQRLAALKAKHQADFNVGYSMNERMEYFNALMHVANTLTDEASNELDSQKNFH